MQTQVARAEAFFLAKRWPEARTEYQNLLSKLAGSARERAVIDRFVDAFEAADTARLVDLTSGLVHRARKSKAVLVGRSRRARHGGAGIARDRHRDRPARLAQAAPAQRCEARGGESFAQQLLVPQKAMRPAVEAAIDRRHLDAGVAPLKRLYAVCVR